MRISAKAEYACVAMVELAAQYTKGQPVSIKAIAEAYGISSGFLIQILLQLKGAGLVASVRGSSGGYQLARAPEAITLADIIHTVDGPPNDASALDNLTDSPVLHAVKGVWQMLLEREEEVLQRATLAELLEQSQSGGTITYQI